MSEKYVFLIDIDGTLIQTGQVEVRKKVANSLLKAKQKGNILSIATGRALQSAMNFKGFEIFDYISCLMGGLIYDINSQKIYRDNNNKLNSQYIKPLIEYFINNKKEWTYKDEKQEKTTFQQNQYNAKIVDERELAQDIKNDNVFQLLATKNLITQDIINKYDKLDFILMPGDYYDIVNKGQTKANIVEFFKQKYPNYKIVAIGDADNDIPMLKASDISIAMGNSSDEIKHLATFTTKTVSEDGVGFAIEQILKI